jgi:hypothetical protein
MRASYAGGHGCRLPVRAIALDTLGPQEGGPVALGQARQYAHNQLYGHTLAMKNGAVGLQKVARVGGAVELAPQSTTGRPVGTEVPQPHPASVVTVGMGAKVHRGIDGTGAAGGRWHGVRSSWRGWLGMIGVVFTRGAWRFVREALEGCGLVGAFALARGGPRCGRRLK